MKTNIWMVAPEAAPFAQTGGMGDVLGSLPCSFSDSETEVSLVIPLYPDAAQHLAHFKRLPGTLDIPIGHYARPATILEGTHPNNPSVKVYMIWNRTYFDREGIYSPTAGGDPYTDNSERFIFFCRAVVELACHLGKPVDVFHCHDWQSGLVPAYVKAQNGSLPGAAKTVFTIHNIAYQGDFPALAMQLVNLGWDLFNQDGMEFHNKLNFLKTGIVMSDWITTVSPTYAKEICQPEFGCGLSDILTHRSARISGIINGIDMNTWDPQTSPYLSANYSSRNLKGKSLCKRHLQEILQLSPSKGPLFSMVTRLAHQKGIDILVPVMQQLLAQNNETQLVVLGGGEGRYHDALQHLAGQFPERAAFISQYSHPLAQQVAAGSDISLMPSLYEPCGLYQLYSLRYGTVPVGRDTGGLSDSIKDLYSHPKNGTGFLFKDYNSEAFRWAIDHAMEQFSNKKEWPKLMRRCMAQDWSWGKSASAYLDLYRKLMS